MNTYQMGQRHTRSLVMADTQTNSTKCQRNCSSAIKQNQQQFSRNTSRYPMFNKIFKTQSQNVDLNQQSSFQSPDQSRPLRKRIHYRKCQTNELDFNHIYLNRDLKTAVQKFRIGTNESQNRQMLNYHFSQALSTTVSHKKLNNIRYSRQETKKSQHQKTNDRDKMGFDFSSIHIRKQGKGCAKDMNCKQTQQQKLDKQLDQIITQNHDDDISNKQTYDSKSILQTEQCNDTKTMQIAKKFISYLSSKKKQPSSELKYKLRQSVRQKVLEANCDKIYQKISRNIYKSASFTKEQQQEQKINAVEKLKDTVDKIMSRNRIFKSISGAKEQQNCEQKFVDIQLLRSHRNLNNQSLISPNRSKMQQNQVRIMVNADLLKKEENNKKNKIDTRDYIKRKVIVLGETESQKDKVYIIKQRISSLCL